MSPVLAGVLLQLLAVILFVALDTTSKYMTAHLPVPQIMFSRFAVHLVTVAVALRVMTGRVPWRPRRPGLQTARSLCLVFSNLLFVMALVFIPLADAAAVGFASPIVTVALAALLLGERVTWLRWLGVGVGFLGVLLTVRPTFLTGEPMHPAMLLPLAMAFTFGIYQILARKLALTDDTGTTILWTALPAFAVTALAQPFFWVTPTPLQAGLLLLAGMCGGFGHWLLVLAYARAPASLLAPMSYSQLVFAIAASALVLGDQPDAWTLAGAAVIALGGVLVALPARRPPSPPEQNP